MFRDYKHQTNQRRGRRASPVVIFLVGLSLGMTVAVPVTLYLSGHSRFGKDPSLAIQPTMDIRQDNSVLAKQFTFYDILTSEETLRVKSGGQPDQAGFKPVIIQLGAFQNESDADNFQAQMALLGFDPHVESVVIPEKGGLWFRVRLGPITSLAEAGRITSQLQAHSVRYAEIYN